MTKKLSICLLLLLAGCGASGGDHDASEPTKVTTYDLGMRYAREFMLSDGTRCVAIMETGITCDWESAEELEQ